MHVERCLTQGLNRLPRRTRSVVWSAVLALALPLGAPLGAQQSAAPPAAAPAPIPEARPADVESVDAIITALYDVISGPAGQKRD